MAADEHVMPVPMTVPMPMPVKAKDYQLFQLVELFYKLKSVDVDRLFDLPPKYDPVRFIGNTRLSFVVRDITSVAVTRHNKYQIETPFLSLSGAHSPLPNYYLDTLVWEELSEQPRLLTLLNIFKHRLTISLHKIWRKYRYSVCFKQNGEDQYSQRMFSLVGLGKPDIRHSLEVNQSKMLSYAGLLASSGRSPQILSALITHCFELSDAKILSWQFRRVPLPRSALNKLAQANFTLGHNFIIGRSMPEYSGKFILSIRQLDYPTMKKLLPTGSVHHSLVNFVAFILRDQLAWDLQLVLANNQVGGMKLGQDTECYLGWTTFLGQPPVNPSALIAIQK